MRSSQILLSLVAVIVLSAIAGVLYSSFAPPNIPAAQVNVVDFTTCIAAGNPAMESYPRQCRSTDGRLFVEEVTPPQPTPVVGAGCAIGGCSNQLCGEAGEIENVATTCEYREAYACYRSASCVQQTSGKCGWTETPELRTCLSSSSSDVPTNIEVE